MGRNAFQWRLTLLFLLVPVCALSQADKTNTLKEWGEEALSMIQSDFLDPHTGLYANQLIQGKRDRPASLWAGGVQLSALVAAASLDVKYRIWLENYTLRLRLYWNDRGPVPGYDPCPYPKGIDRYYDDNAWVVLAYLEAYTLLKDDRYLPLAEKTMSYVLSGLDEKCGGGIYWRERDKASKNTCSNAPSALACFRLHLATEERQYLEKGDEILDWLLETLQDPEDHLMWDHINVKTVEIEKTKWSYNTALTFHTLGVRSQLAKRKTRRQAYWQEAHVMADSALKRWWDPEAKAFRNGLRFDHLLAEAFLKMDLLENTLRYTPHVISALETLHRNAPDKHGHYPGQWAAKTNHPLERVELLDQASAARAYLACARALAVQQ